jgi:uncharacterized membrane protein YbhN (UPF0104 family)
MKWRWSPLLKLGASLALIGWVAWTVDTKALGHALLSIDADGILVALVLLVAQSIVLAWRWHRIVVMLGGRMRRSDAVRWVLIGQFFNGALPTSIGGDALRVWLLHRSGVAGGLAVQSVLVERVTGLVVLGLIVSGCVPSVWSELSMSPGARIALSLAGPGLALAVTTVVLLGRFGSGLLPERAAGALRTTVESLYSVARQPRLVTEVAAMACVASLIGLAAGQVLVNALGINTSFPVTATLLGGAMILTVAPVSLGGWGVREVGMVALFGSVGVPAERALALSLLWGVLPLLIALPAFLIWRSDRSAPPPPNAETSRP